MKATTLIVLILPMLVAAVHDLQAKYPFHATLFDDQGQYYGLYWDFSIPTIHIAVNVSTTGWVGFGVSPTGQMPGSDVIIGWVTDDGTAYFHVRKSTLNYMTHATRQVSVQNCGWGGGGASKR